MELLSWYRSSLCMISRLIIEKTFVLQELEQWCQDPNVDWMVVAKRNNIRRDLNGLLNQEEV